jgi:hypothetical protein
MIPKNEAIEDAGRPQEGLKHRGFCEVKNEKMSRKFHWVMRGITAMARSSGWFCFDALVL